MIRREIVDGKPATVAYLDDQFQPVAPGEAMIVKVIFDDGRVAFGVIPIASPASP